MKKAVLSISAAVMFGIAGTASLSASAAETYIAGTDPSQRPPLAPAIKVVEKPDGWYTHALKGVAPPYPYSLHFLENQGNWYTPFTNPGMPGRYDIRGWHR